VKNCDFLVKILLFLAKKQQINNKIAENWEKFGIFSTKKEFKLRTLFL